MPDISMCADDECPSRAECYRHKESGTKPHLPWQAFTDYQRKPEDERCAEFQPVLHTKPRRVGKAAQTGLMPL
jgi:hypothetical protein